MNFITLNNIENQELIHDIMVRPLKVNKDKTGTLVETLRKDWNDVYDGREFAMQYYSKTESGIARDENVWHYHPTGQEDRFLVVEGSIVVAIADNRDNSQTKNLLNLFHMEAEIDPYMVIVPKQTLHGFIVVSKNPAILLNFPTRLYNPNEEGRIPYEKAQVQAPGGSIFSWDLVRKEFQL